MCELLLVFYLHFKLIGEWNSGTILGKSSAPFSLGGDDLKRYFDQR